MRQIPLIAPQAEDRPDPDRPGPPEEAASDRTALTKAELLAVLVDREARLSECRSRNQRLCQRLLALGVAPGELAWQPEGEVSPQASHAALPGRREAGA